MSTEAERAKLRRLARVRPKREPVVLTDEERAERAEELRAQRGGLTLQEMLDLPLDSPKLKLPLAPPYEEGW